MKNLFYIKETDFGIFLEFRKLPRRGLTGTETGTGRGSWAHNESNKRALDLVSTLQQNLKRKSKNNWDVGLLTNKLV